MLLFFLFNIFHRRLIQILRQINYAGISKSLNFNCKFIPYTEQCKIIIDNQWVFGRACAPVRCAHPSFWAHCHTNQGAARPPPIEASLLVIQPPKPKKICRIRAPHVMGFYFPLDHRGHEIGSPLPPAPPIAASLFLILPPKLNKIYRTGAAHVMGFFLSAGSQGLRNRKSPTPRPPPHCSFADPSSNILGSKLCTGATKQSFDLFFLLISSYSPFLISSYSPILILVFLNGSYSSYSSRTILCLIIFLFLYFNLFVVLQTHKLCISATIRPYFCVLSFFIVF